jgi:hypothetical protein
VSESGNGQQYTMAKIGLCLLRRHLPDSGRAASGGCPSGSDDCKFLPALSSVAGHAPIHEAECLGVFATVA